MVEKFSAVKGASSSVVAVVGRAFQPRVRAIGVDTIQVMTAAFLASLQAFDPAIEYIGRYVDTLTPSEVSLIHGAGYAILPFTYAGEFDPSPRLASLAALGCPAGVTLVLDVESVQIPTAQLVTQINGWAAAVKAAGYDPGGYVGAASGLSAEQWGDLAIDRYVRSCSLVPESSEGFVVEQLFPPDIHVGSGLVVDYLVARQDYERRSVTLWAA